MCGEVINGMADTIAELERKLAEREWIPCSERLPNNEQYDWVLAAIREKTTGVYACGSTTIKTTEGYHHQIPRIMEYRENKGDWYDREYGWLKGNLEDIWEVIAWMPLPEPYKESEE